MLLIYGLVYLVLKREKKVWDKFHNICDTYTYCTKWTQKKTATEVTVF